MNLYVPTESQIVDTLLRVLLLLTTTTTRTERKEGEATMGRIEEGKENQSRSSKVRICQHHPQGGQEGSIIHPNGG